MHIEADTIRGEILVFFFVESSSSSGACDPNPCQNDGTCEDIGNGNYKCECPGVYGGDNCEKGKLKGISCLSVYFIKSITLVAKVSSFCSQKHTKHTFYTYVFT